MASLRDVSRVDVRLLGPLEILVDGTPAALGGPHPRALMALLALSAGTAVSTSRLVDLLWNGNPPPTAANTVQVYVSRLRRALRPPDTDPPLHATRGGYVLAVPVEAVDALRFDRLATDGHTLLAAGDAEGATVALDAALELWRGPALPDLAGLTGVEGQKARLSARHLAARIDRIDVEMLGERHAQVLPELEELLHRHPLDEGLVARLMTALYRSGRQADALAAYTAAVTRLADELGIDPGPQLRQTHTDILRQEVPPASTGASRPEPQRTGPPTTGPAHTRPAHTEPAPTRPPNTRPPNTRPVNTRPPHTEPACAEPACAEPTRAEPTRAGRSDAAIGGHPEAAAPLRVHDPLVGRRRELLHVLGLLGDPQIRLITLLGPGGTGKTRLALEVARLLATPGGDAPDREVAVVPLAAVSDSSELLAATCRALDAVPGWAGEPLLDVAVRALAGRQAVLVLDNLEQLAPDPVLVEDLVALLDGVPDLTVVCTSRTVLHLRGEHLLPLDPLPLPELAADGAELVLRSDAVRLFRDRAAAVLPEFEVTEANAAAVAGVCRMLDGLPLALELAAARIRVLPPEGMLRRVGQRLRLLSGGARDLPDRHRSMRATLDWSARLLEPDEARLFAQLSVFSGGWTVEAAEAVCDVGGDVLELVAQLVDKSLVATGGDRMSMLETVREYAAELLLEQGGAGTVQGRHARYYADLAEHLGPQCRISPDCSTRARLDAESGNLAAALEHAATCRDGALLGRLVLGLLDYWFFSGRIGRADRWMRAVQAARVPPQTQTRLQLSAGSLAFVEGDLARAVPAFAAAVRASHELGDTLLAARSLAASGAAARHGGDLEGALELVEQALALARTAGLGAMIPQLENELGEVLDGLGRPEEAAPLFEAYHRRSLLDDDHSNLAWACGNLAVQAQERGDTARAEELAAAAIQAADEGGSAPVRGDSRAVAGLLALTRGDAARALPLLGESLGLTQSAGLLLALPDTVSLLGAALLESGRAAAAARALATGRAWRQARGLAVNGRLVARTIAVAEQRVAHVLVADVHAEESARGSRAPYGWVLELDVPSPAEETGVSEGRT